MRPWGNFFVANFLGILMLGLLLGAIGCGGTSSSIESAEFHLDQAQYDEAIAILDDIVDQDPENLKAVTLLASALFARGFLGQNNTYLGVFSDFLDNKEGGDSNMEGIRRATPAAASEGRADIYRAEDLLRDIPRSERRHRPEAALQLGFVQLAVIAIVGVVEIGAKGVSDPCEIDFDALNGEDGDRLDRALSEVNDNFEDAGISDFGTTDLGEQITEMDQGLEAAVDTQAFLEEEYGATGC